MVAAMLILLSGYQLPQPPSSLGDLVALVKRKKLKIITHFIMNVEIGLHNYYGSDLANHSMSPVQQMRQVLPKSFT
jgi:hypothetical protein